MCLSKSLMNTSVLFNNIFFIFGENVYIFSPFSLETVLFYDILIVTLGNRSHKGG